ncbi:MAG: hypothetical protein BWY11_00246 [Firmicutes bacterium ADurb.Bin182]|nr:MAG: hypothetical protein BWY11_00246 [Firmicutes bacterium ADurb.Bin182]
MDGFSHLPNIFAVNLLRFDFIIFIAAFVNLIIYILVRRESKKLYRKMHLTIFIPSHGMFKNEADELLIVDETDIIAMRKKSGMLYNVFTALTSIFCLLGILGTVISLIPMVEQMDVIKTNFFLALTSTFWGLVFAIIFKTLDAFISGIIDDNEKTVALYLERNAKRFAVKE